MKIENPNVVGSGFIQHPPMQRFSGPMVFQPPTFAHEFYPEEYEPLFKTGLLPPPAPAAPVAAAAPPQHGYRPAPVPVAVPRPAPAPAPHRPAPQGQGHAHTHPSQQARPAPGVEHVTRQVRTSFAVNPSFQFPYV